VLPVLLRDALEGLAAEIFDAGRDVGNDEADEEAEEDLKRRMTAPCEPEGGV
jgi:hypothetical protein